MRRDMYKVIVERPRRGVRSAKRIKLRHDRLPDRTKVGMRRAAKEQVGWVKSFNDHLAPLRRFLWSRRGRPWSRVYGEICATLDMRHTVKRHVLEHIEDFIVVRVTVGRDGRWLGHGGWYGPDPLEHCRQALYVDPDDGIVKETAKFRRKLGLPATHRRPRRSRRGDEIVLSADTELRRIAGVWYGLRFERHPDAPPRARVYDLLARTMVWPGDRHAVRKHQLSKAQLASYGLSNDPRPL